MGERCHSVRALSVVSYSRILTVHWYRWKFTRSVVLDGNFSAQHRKMRRPEDDVALADGHAFMVTDAPYKEHLKTAAEFREVRLRSPDLDGHGLLIVLLHRGGM